MDTYLDSPIKEVIDRFPEVGAILDEYGVGCVTCGVGTCPVKDIISIHHLAPEDESAVMARIAEAIGSAEPVAAPARDRGSRAGESSAAPGPAAPARGAGMPPTEGGTIRYSPPLKQLVDEHTLIKRWLALIPAVLEKLDLESAGDRHLVLDGVDFIRSYADRYHHAKEEDILFTYYDADRPIIKIMLADHEQARGHARAAEQGVRERNREKVTQHLEAYRRLLSEHIKKEDEILYPWMDRDLTTGQVGELFARFAEVDANMTEVSARNTQFVERAERLVSQNKEKEAA
jgi:hemerythrin-like domain-containing protein